MKNNTIFTMMKKELCRFFKDSRMVATTILLPGVMIFVLYSLMGTAMREQFQPDKFAPECQVVNLPEDWKEPLEKQGFQLDVISGDEEGMKLAKEQISNQKSELLAVFPENFIKDTAEGTGLPPQVKIYYNSASTDSGTAYGILEDYLNQYESSLANRFDINNSTEEKFDLATDEDTTGKFFSTMVPFLLLIFLYSGCISVAPESMAGEKERGTMASLLITPAKRSHIALGKISALSIIAVLSGASSAIGTFLSIPNLLEEESGINQSVYAFSDYVLLALIILSTALVLITLISLVSAFAKDLKEAQTYVTPLMVLVMLVGITAMFGDGAKTYLGYYCIPLYNSVQSMVGIFSFQATTVQIFVTVAVNLLATGAGALILSKMFDSEYIMFHK